MSRRVLGYHTWDVEPHGDSAVSVGVGCHAAVLPSILSPHLADLQERIGQQLHPPCPCPDSMAPSVPGQIVAHVSLHLTGQHSHASHRRCHIHRGLQDRRRICFSECRRCLKQIFVQTCFLPGLCLKDKAELCI